MEQPNRMEMDLTKRATAREPLMVLLVECPVCRETLCHQDEDVQENFCPKCGQDLNWERLNKKLPNINETLKESDKQ